MNPADRLHQPRFLFTHLIQLPFFSFSILLLNISALSPTKTHDDVFAICLHSISESVVKTSTALSPFQKDLPIPQKQNDISRRKHLFSYGR